MPPRSPGSKALVVMQGDDSMRDDQKATMNGLRLRQHTYSENASDGCFQISGRGHLAERVIAAFRRAGISCGVMISEDETLH